MELSRLNQLHRTLMPQHLKVAGRRKHGMVDIYDLGVILKDLDNFSMKTFSDRLRFQKTIQLLQAFGVDLGYSYNWYLSGPYCSTLAKDGYELAEVIHKIPKLDLEFANNTLTASYTAFKDFIQDKKNDPDQLEIAASICFLHQQKNLDKDTVLRLTEGKKQQFTKKGCERIWNELAGYGVI